MCFLRVDAQVLNASDRELVVSIQEADIGMLYVIQRELLKSSSVNFAGVIVKHPLTNECWLRVISSKGAPAKEIERATAAAQKTVTEIKTAFGSKLGSK